ncbi:tetratricopeptide repeat-containing sulfotransferase family protein [Oceanicoccus sagamiensis]|uniref:Sulfotransferase n=1 Tax=Oceanicoccus sagamiensis TaxID=716816 RepID=A0A1X9N9J4_9GAMM|nr:sulfotransferase [Oceanicoccus sagamiensis]ARN73102.1 sulfotransferase [Oceanicoccus sagamiensis]
MTTKTTATTTTTTTANTQTQVTLQSVIARGFRALSQGKLDEARGCCMAVLKQQPNNEQTHFLVGLIGLASGDRKKAALAFATVTRLNPGHVAAWAHLAKLQAQNGQINRADHALAMAVKHENGDIAEVQDVIASCYSMLGEHQIAHQWFKKAAAKAPDNLSISVNLASSQIFLGKTQAAKSQLTKVLALAPNIGQAHWLLSGLAKANNTQHIESIENLLTDPSIPSQAEAFLCYGAGKECEDLENWDQAFRYFERGAKARRKHISFDNAQEEETFKALTNTYTEQWLASQSDYCDTSAPIFIVGQPRTGTTLVERIITSHSQVHSAGELMHFGNAVRRQSNYEGSERFSASLFESAASLDGKKLGAAYMTSTARLRGDAPHFVDKLPYNYLFLPLILAALPNARIIHLVRDPMDVCFSVYKQLFADAYPHSYDLEAMAKHFVRYYRLMELWRQRFPGRFLDVRYEAVAADVETEGRRIMNYLQLPWEDVCANFHQQDTAVTTASAVQVRQPAHTRSIGRWRRYEKQLQPVRDRLLEENII